MFISTRQSQVSDDPIKEHTENIGGPTVSIEPAYQARIQRAVDFINSYNAGLLRDITDVIGHLNVSSFGQFSEANPHSLFVNIEKIESEVKSQLQDATVEQIQQEIENQIIKTIVHEATHKQEISDTGNTTEQGPEAAEKAMDQFLSPSASISTRDTVLTRLRAKGA